jgi:hypothetical protein
VFYSDDLITTDSEQIKKIDQIKGKLFMEVLNHDISFDSARLVFGKNMKIKIIFNNNHNKKIFIEKFPKLKHEIAIIMFERKSTIIIKKCFYELMEKLIAYFESENELMNQFSNNLFALLIEGLNESVILKSPLILPVLKCMIPYLNDENMKKMLDIDSDDIIKYSLFTVVPPEHKFYKYITDNLIAGNVSDATLATISKLPLEILDSLLKYAVSYMKYRSVLELMINIYNANVEKSYDEMYELMKNMKPTIEEYDPSDVTTYIINKSRTIELKDSDEKISYSFVKYIVNEYPKIKSTLEHRLINRTKLICKSYKGCTKHDSVRLIIADDRLLGFDELYELLTINVMVYANMDADDIIKCKICMENNIDTVYADCGHTVCKTCAREMAKCPFCRKKSETYKIIIS